MRIIGIDPGLARVGIALVDASSPHDIQAREWFTIETEAGHAMGERLQEISADLRSILRAEKPDLAAVERLFFAVNEKTAFDVAQVRGVILLTLAEENIAHLEPTPLQLKAAITGDGKASKQQMQDMLTRMLGLSARPTPDDAADALALAVFGALHSSHVDRAASR